MKVLAVSCVVAAMTLTGAGSAAAGSKPIPPTVNSAVSRTIPWFECYDAAEWVGWTNTPKGKGVSLWVTVRKPGYTQPIKGGRICGYMGSGTYNLRIRMDWEMRKKVRVRKPVYRWKTVQELVGYRWTEPVYENRAFTCAMTEGIPPKYANGGYGSAYYSCSFDGGQPWVIPEDSAGSPYPTNQADSRLVFYTGSDRALGLYSGAAESGSLPQVLTGSSNVLVQDEQAIPIYEPREKRYVHHYRNARVWKWVEAKSFYVNRSIQVTVR